VGPGASLEYAWDEPQAARRLRCVLEGQGVAYRDAMHQYSLDEIRVPKRCPIAASRASCRACPCLSRDPDCPTNFLAVEISACYVQVYPPIKLKKANMRLDRLAGKVVTGVGSAAKSARRIVSRIGSAADGPMAPQQVTKHAVGNKQANVVRHVAAITAES
jgi:hypothetical protein